MLDDVFFFSRSERRLKHIRRKAMENYLYRKYQFGNNGLRILKCGIENLNRWPEPRVPQEYDTLFGFAKFHFQALQRGVPSSATFLAQLLCRSVCECSSQEPGGKGGGWVCAGHLDQITTKGSEKWDRLLYYRKFALQ